MRRTAGAMSTLLVLALAGCGGSGRLSSSDLTNQASQICALTARQTNLIKSPAAPSGSETFLRQGITAVTPEVDKLRKLRPPADAEDVYKTAVDSSARKLELLRTAAKQIAGGADPVSTMQSLEQQLAPVVQQENGAWKSLGIPACITH
jgi:subtilisin family serine protease